MLTTVYLPIQAKMMDFKKKKEKKQPQKQQQSLFEYEGLKSKNKQTKNNRAYVSTKALEFTP